MIQLEQAVTSEPGPTAEAVMAPLDELLRASAARHRHLCPRQVLGVRMGLYGGAILDLPVPQTDKRLYVIAETDGCALGAIVVATNCSPGRRTMVLEDFGKIAATFVDTQSARAVRIVPRPPIRSTATAYAPEARSKWESQLLGYQRMPYEELFELQEVQLLVSIRQLISQPGYKAICDRCGEEINNEREVVLGRTTLCRACAGQSYYALLAVLPATHAVSECSSTSLHTVR
jgi:formylmethanofuran dehydrogenase subunit E